MRELHRRTILDPAPTGTESSGMAAPSQSNIATMVMIIRRPSQQLSWIPLTTTNYSWAASRGRVWDPTPIPPTWTSLVTRRPSRRRGPWRSLAYRSFSLVGYSGGGIARVDDSFAVVVRGRRAIRGRGFRAFLPLL